VTGVATFGPAESDDDDDDNDRSEVTIQVQRGDGTMATPSA